MDLLKGSLKIPVPVEHQWSKPENNTKKLKRKTNNNNKTKLETIRSTKYTNQTHPKVNNKDESETYLCRNSRPPAVLDSEPNSSISPSHCCRKREKSSVQVTDEIQLLHYKLYTDMHMNLIPIFISHITKYDYFFPWDCNFATDLIPKSDLFLILITLDPLDERNYVTKRDNL